MKSHCLRLMRNIIGFAASNSFNIDVRVASITFGHVQFLRKYHIFRTYIRLNKNEFCGKNKQINVARFDKLEPYETDVYLLYSSNDNTM